MPGLQHIIRQAASEHRARRRVRLSRSLGGTIAIFLFLVVIGAFMALPILYSILQAFKPLDEIFAYPPRFFVRRPTMDNFRQVLQLADNLSVPFARYATNSILISAVGTAFYVLIASLTAYPLAKAKFPGAVLISNVIVWTLMFRPEVTGIPQYFVLAGLGMVDTVFAILLPAMASTMGVFLMKQFIIASIPDATLEAARIDGAGEMRIFWKIVMPSIKPAWLTLIIFTFQSMWNATGVQYVYSEPLKMLPSVLQTISAGGIARTGAGSAVAVVLMIPPVLIFILSQSSVMETMSHSGLK